MCSTLLCAEHTFPVVASSATLLCAQSIVYMTHLNSGLLSFLLEWLHNASLHAHTRIHIHAEYVFLLCQPEKKHSPHFDSQIYWPNTTFCQNPRNKLSSLSHSCCFSSKVVIPKNYTLLVKSTSRNRMHAHARKFIESKVIAVNTLQSECVCVYCALCALCAVCV